MIASARARGRLEDEVLDELGIPRGPNFNERDRKVLNQQGPPIVTHRHTVARFEAYNERVITGKASASRASAAKQLKAIQKRADDKAETQRKSAEETTRKSAMSKEDLAKYHAEKRAATAKSKRDKELRDAARFARLTAQAACEVVDDERVEEDEEEQEGEV
jgi:hypothetical protein